MTSASVALPAVLPQGAIFGASGYDGPTSIADGFVALLTCQADGPGKVRSVTLRFGRSGAADLTLGLAEPLACDFAVNDTLTAGPLRVVAVSGRLIRIDCPAGTSVLTGSGDTHTGIETGTEAVLRPANDDSADERALILARTVCLDGGLRVLIGAGASVAEARARLEGADLDLDDLIAGRKAFYQDQLSAIPARWQPLAGKCLSVIRVNTMAAGDFLEGPWSTPDRIPHRDMWLWDTAFHSLGANHIDPVHSFATLSTVVAMQQADGMIPLCFGPQGSPPKVTQPPILAWAVRRNAEHRLRAVAVGAARTDETADVVGADLRAVFPALTAYLRWFDTHRLDPATGLASWLQTDDPLCRSGESGMDNSPRFDLPTGADVDLSVYLAHDYQQLAWIADHLGEADAAQVARGRAATLTAAVHQQMWDPAQQFYVDLRRDGTFSGVRAVSGFLPLLLEDLSGDRLAALLVALDDPTDFGTAAPVPSVSARDRQYSTDMWRGPAWVNLNYLVAAGLRRYQQDDRAAALMARTADLVEAGYRRFGVTFEFYDSADITPPTRCDRKGPALADYRPGVKIDSIRDYHWTAALLLDALISV